MNNRISVLLLEQRKNGLFAPEIDLRSDRRQHWSLKEQVVAMEDTHEVIPDEIPDDIQSGGEVFLKNKKNQLTSDSYRMIPAKINRFVQFVGESDCSEIGTTVWERWKEHVNDSDLSLNTKRVSYNRSKKRKSINSRWNRLRKRLSET